MVVQVVVTGLKERVGFQKTQIWEIFRMQNYKSGDLLDIYGIRK